MTPRPRGSAGDLLSWIGEALDSAALARAFTVCVFGTVFASFALQRLTSVVTYTTILAGLVALGIGILIRRRRELDLIGLIPLTLVVFLGWLIVTTAWSSAPVRTLGGWVGTAGLAFLAIVVAQVRDTLQTARALGDVLRALLAVSLALEILSGILIDLPIDVLGIEGNLAFGGPVQGIFGTRNMLGLVAVLALITFLVEWRTHAVRPGIALSSAAMALLLALFSASPTVLVLIVATAAAVGALAVVRHARPQARRALQISLATLVLAILAVAYALRHTVIAVLNAGSDFTVRADLWNTILEYVGVRPVQGWGWFGGWERTEFPFLAINVLTGERHASALNAYFDVLLQAGWVGLILFAAMCVLATVRGWLAASTRRSVVYAWTPLILIALLVDSVFESFTLQGAGWLLLVVTVVRAGLSRSWRGGDDRRGPNDPLPPETGAIELPPQW